jgi:hypothetical protein
MMPASVPIWAVFVIAGMAAASSYGWGRWNGRAALGRARAAGERQAFRRRLDHDAQMIRGGYELDLDLEGEPAWFRAPDPRAPADTRAFAAITRIDSPRPASAPGGLTGPGPAAPAGPGASHMPSDADVRHALALIGAGHDITPCQYHGGHELGGACGGPSSGPGAAVPASVVLAMADVPDRLAMLAAAYEYEPGEGGGVAEQAEDYLRSLMPDHGDTERWQARMEAERADWCARNGLPCPRPVWA